MRTNFFTKFLITSFLTISLFLVTTTLFQGSWNTVILDPRIYRIFLPVIGLVYIIISIQYISKLHAWPRILSVTSFIVVTLVSGGAFLLGVFHMYGEWYDVSKCNNSKILINYGTAGSVSEKVLLGSKNTLFLKQLKSVQPSENKSLSIKENNNLTSEDIDILNKCATVIQSKPSPQFIEKSYINRY